MPLYEFKCKRCEKVFEEIQLTRDGRAKVTCPSCGSKATERLISTPARAVAGSQKNKNSVPKPPTTRCGSKSGFS